MRGQYTAKQVVELLKRAQGKKTQRAFAAEVGIAQQYLCDVLKGRRTLGPTILRYLGLEVGYVKSDAKPESDSEKAA